MKIETTLPYLERSPMRRHQNDPPPQPADDPPIDGGDDGEGEPEPADE